MRLVIPFKQNIKFDTNIYEICSISLEHEITKNENELLGNFIFEGTYKEHELSINDIPFSFIVPFSVDFDTRINIDTIDFSIDNFTYNVLEDSLDVAIDYIVLGDEISKEDIQTQKDLEERDVQIISPIEYPEEPIIVEEEKAPIMDLKLDDEYVKYHVHVAKSNDTFESIASLYNVEITKIQKINNTTEIKENDHLIIPI